MHVDKVHLSCFHYAILGFKMITFIMSYIINVLMSYMLECHICVYPFWEYWMPFHGKCQTAVMYVVKLGRRSKVRIACNWDTSLFSEIPHDEHNSDIKECRDLISIKSSHCEYNFTLTTAKSFLIRYSYCFSHAYLS